MTKFKDRLRKAADHAKVTWGQTSVAKSLGMKKQTVDRWFDEGEPKAAQIFAIADLWGINARWLATGEGDMLGAADQGDLAPKEGILLLLFRGLFSHQHREVIQELRALFDANQIVRKELGQKTLKGVSNEAVEVAFGAVPAPTKKPSKKPATKDRRPPGAAMGDYLEEE